VDQGWQFSAEFLAESVDLSQLSAVTFTGLNYPFAGIAFAILSADYDYKTKILSVSGVDSVTNALKNEYTLPQNMTAGEVSTCAAVLAPLTFTGSAPSFSCFAPQGEGLKNIDVLRGYCSAFGGLWRADSQQLRLFDINGTNEQINIAAADCRILEAVLTYNYYSFVNPRLQCSRQTGSRFSVENAANTVQVLKKLTNPNAPAEAVTPNAAGGVNVPDLTPEEEQAANSKYPADIFIDPWTKTAQRIYVPLEMPYYDTAIKITVQYTETYRCTFITAEAEEWALHLFPITTAGQAQPGPSAEGAYIFDRVKEDIELPAGDYFARVQRKILVSNGYAIEFPHAPGISIELASLYSIQAPYFVLSESNSDANVFTSSAYYFTSSGYFNGQPIAQALKARNEIDLKTLKLQLLPPSYSDVYKNVRIGSVVSVGFEGRSYTGLCIQTNMSISAEAESLEITLSLPMT
jgi:hypothetical protein